MVAFLKMVRHSVPLSWSPRGGLSRSTLLEIPSEAKPRFAAEAFFCLRGWLRVPSLITISRIPATNQAIARRDPTEAIDINVMAPGFELHHQLQVIGFGDMFIAKHIAYGTRHNLQKTGHFTGATHRINDVANSFDWFVHTLLYSLDMKECKDFFALLQSTMNPFLALLLICHGTNKRS